MVLVLFLVLALGNYPFLNERQQTGIGLVMDRVGLSLINVLDRNCFSVEVKDVSALRPFGFGVCQKIGIIKE